MYDTMPVCYVTTRTYACKLGSVIATARETLHNTTHTTPLPRRPQEFTEVDDSDAYTESGSIDKADCAPPSTHTPPTPHHTGFFIKFPPCLVVLR